MIILAYVSGHGFGHAVRVCEVLRALRACRGDVRVVVRSPLARWFFDLNLGGEIVHGACRLDVGVVQPDSLTADLDATLRECAVVDADAERLVVAEVEAVALYRPALVLADIPALAFPIAQRLGVPGVAMTNFSWDWIYADYARDLPAFVPLVERLRDAYRRATLLLRLPLHGDLSVFPNRRDIPLVARRASLPAAVVRERLGLPAEERVVLLSFGGIGLALPEAPRLRGVTFVSTGGAAVGGEAPPGCRPLPRAELARVGVRYEDLVGAADAVLTKPGYGIVAECIANATPIVYTPRGRFAEYDCLVAGIRAHLPNAFLGSADLRAGRWAGALEAVFSAARPAAAPRIDGAEVAADELLAIAS